MKRTILVSLALVLVAALAVAPAFAGKGKAVGKTKSCRATVAYVVRGPAVATGSDSVTLTVEAANKHARWFLGRDVPVTVNAATKISRNEEEAAVADIVPGDALTVMIRGCKGADPATLSLVAHHIDAVSSSPEEEGEEEPAPAEEL